MIKNVIVAAILILVIGGAIFYIVRSKKRGVKCIGCPSGTNCGGNCSNCSTCGNCRNDSDCDE